MSELGVQKTSAVVVNWIESAILEGRLVVGDRLPAERELAAQWGVGRSAVREAVRALQAQGVVTSSVGQAGGTRIAAQQGAALAKLLRLQVALAGFPVDDVTDLRVALERASVAASCREANAAALDRLQDLVTRMASTTDRAGFNDLDTEFHVAIAAAGGNSLVSDLTVAVRESLQQPILDAEEKMDDWSGFHATLCQQHAEILDAIRSGDAARAQDAVETHIREAWAILLPSS